MPLNEEQKDFFNALEDTFRSKGWELIKQGWQNELNQIAEAAFFNVKTIEELALARERRSLLAELVNLPAAIAAQRKHIEETSSDE